MNAIAIIGAGQMGAGIAHVCALAGLDAVDGYVEQERLDARQGANVGDAVAHLAGADDADFIDH